MKCPECKRFFVSVPDDYRGLKRYDPKLKMWMGCIDCPAIVSRHEGYKTDVRRTSPWLSPKAWIVAASLEQAEHHAVNKLGLRNGEWLWVDGPNRLRGVKDPIELAGTWYNRPDAEQIRAMLPAKAPAK